MEDTGSSNHPTPRRPRYAAGPFEGYRLGALDVPVRIHHLSAEGCLVELTFGLMGDRVTLQVDLPGEGWTTVQCDAMKIGGPYGFAVRFVNLSDDTRCRIERTIDRFPGPSLDDEGPAGDGAA